MPSASKNCTMTSQFVQLVSKKIRDQGLYSWSGLTNPPQGHIMGL